MGHVMKKVKLKNFAAGLIMWKGNSSINKMALLKQTWNFVLNYIFFLIIKTPFFVKKQDFPKGLLLIRLDSIGDYVLFRNFIKILAENDQFRDHEFTLVGNMAWKILSEKLDADYIDKFIWIDRKKYQTNLIYRFLKLKELTTMPYDIVVSSIYSREPLVDGIVKTVQAREKVGSSGDLSNINRLYKEITNRWYTTLIKGGPSLIFEFDRNRKFFENFLKTNLDIKSPSIQIETNYNNLPDRYAVLFIGANASFRKWGIDKFAHMADFLVEQYQLNIILSGGPGELRESQEFDSIFKKNYINLVGKTSLIELLSVLKNSKVIVSNDTSIPHFAVALSAQNIFVISNGNHFGRFSPYPKEIHKSYHLALHPKMNHAPEQYSKTYNCSQISNLNINDISADQVSSLIKNKLSKNL